MTGKTLLQIAGFIISTIGLIIATLEFSEDTVASIFGISKSNITDSTLILNKMSNWFRFSMILIYSFLYIIVVIIYNYLTKKEVIIQHSYIKPHAEMIKDIIDFIEKNTEVKSLKIWGYSLNWVSDISAFLHENPRRSLKVKLFIPELNEFDKLFEDEYMDERKSVLQMRLKEWKRLKTDNYINSLDIYYKGVIPNDLGVIINENKGFFGTYNWDLQGNGQVKHRRIDKAKRLRFNLTEIDETSTFLCEYHNQRLLCREKDSKHETL
ncbi:MAG: hypothetical protein ACOCQD_05365 [archaeon]